MDKLQPQTVYVPVVDQASFRIHNNYNSNFVSNAKKVTGVYPLTGKELAELLSAYDLSSIRNVKEFLKSKGVEI